MNHLVPLPNLVIPCLDPLAYIPSDSFVGPGTKINQTRVTKINPLSRLLP